MYIPKYFLPKNDSHVEELIKENPLVTVHSIVGTTLHTTHLPVLWENADTFLIAHIAKGNPHFRVLKEVPEAFLLVQGPNCYISPEWYQSGRDVPTWNYITAQLRVKVECLDDEASIVEILKKQSIAYERANQTEWQFELPSDLSAPGALPKYIMGLKFHILEKEVKVKMNQNRPEEDAFGVMEALKARTSRNAQEVFRWMKEYNPTHRKK